MSANVGLTDRVLRIVLGLALIAVALGFLVRLIRPRGVGLA